MEANSVIREILNHLFVVYCIVFEFRFFWWITGKVFDALMSCARSLWRRLRQRRV